MESEETMEKPLRIYKATIEVTADLSSVLDFYFLVFEVWYFRLIVKLRKFKIVNFGYPEIFF